MQTDPPAGVSASPIADNVMTWYASPHPRPPRTRHRTPRFVLRSSSWATHAQLYTQSEMVSLTVEQERSYHRPRRHTVRGWHLSPRHALRRSLPEQAAWREVHQSDVPPKRIRNGRAVLGYPAEQVVADVRCGSNLDKYPEVWNVLGAVRPLRIRADNL
jgi:hypothetical protein